MGYEMKNIENDEIIIKRREYFKANDIYSENVMKFNDSKRILDIKKREYTEALEKYEKI